ncbi:MAG: hypothetical protein QOC80_270, partial [Frankiaceae bacterium]|nr:hypothetical protein [Frankiaceae bacterium]
MPSVPALPKPLSAYVGLLASTAETARDAVRQGPAGAARLPLLALSQVLSSRERYDELAQRGEILLGRLLSRLGGQAQDVEAKAAKARRTAEKRVSGEVQGQAAALSGKTDTAKAAAREASDRVGAEIEEARRKVTALAG